MFPRFPKFKRLKALGCLLRVLGSRNQALGTTDATTGGTWSQLGAWNPGAVQFWRWALITITILSGPSWSALRVWPNLLGTLGMYKRLSDATFLPKCRVHWIL